MASTDSQRANEALEQKDQVFIKEFSGIAKADDLANFEKAHQKRILDGSIYVKDAFDRRWRDLTTNPYFAPITMRPTPSSGPMASGLHPKMTNYRVKRTFRQIRWKKTIHEIPRGGGAEPRKITVYDVFGTMMDGKEVAIERNVDGYQLHTILNETLASKILSHKASEETITIDPMECSVIGYWMVMFTPSQNTNDPNDVTLNWNGNCLQIQRGEHVVLPGYYLEIADNATYPKYIQTPQVSRKVIGQVQFFPYTVLREATEEEYIIQKREGDRLTKEARRRETEL